MTSSPGIPSPEQVRDLTDVQIEAAYSTWWTYHNAPEYLAGREAVVRAAGGTLYELHDLIDSDAKLSALARAVRERARSVQDLKGLDSSVRWAYLAGTHPDAVTPEQAHALTAGWSAAIAPSPGGRDCGARSAWRAPLADVPRVLDPRRSPARRTGQRRGTI